MFALDQLHQQPPRACCTPDVVATVGMPSAHTRFVSRTLTGFVNLHAVTVAESGSEAVSLLRAHPPGTFHLVLTVSCSGICLRSAPLDTAALLPASV